MKKRLLTLALALSLAVTVFAGLGATVSAADDRVTGYLVSYTFQAGDTIYGVCEKQGINFDANLALIGKINNITNYNYMMPGKVLWLPSGKAVTNEAYYTLLAHTLVAGETPASLCQSYGIDYNANYNLLAALNTNLSTFMTGQVFTLPVYVEGSSSPGVTGGTNNGNTGANATPIPVPGGNNNNGNTGTAGGTTGGAAGGITGTTTGPASYYLAQHVLQAGETVSGVCAALGVNFTAAVSDQIQRLNDIANYNYMLPGKTLLIPTNVVPTNGSYYKIVAHTVVAGDTVFDLCTKFGLAYDAYSSLISKLNNRTNLASFYVGETLYMPQYVAAASTGTGAAGGTTGTTGTTGNTGTTNAAPTPTPKPGATPIPLPNRTPVPDTSTGTGTTGTTGGTTGSAPTGDSLAYVIIPHVLQAGETVSQICVDLGVDFDSNYDRIMQLSNISSYNYLLPGKEILIPANAAPSSGPYYKIMQHTLVAGDTVYDLCTRYGLNYNNNVAFLQRINNRDNMATFYVGQIIYMPLYVAG